ncbi:hypothetical protein [Fodinicola acaciae]|uniref:hypothetical protein n=1 Tax=Fodinicola acaciae TaxID=2681555 RepID=UPI0013CF7277|nr:hypothetical protein [Fodinicola acaciae]
MTYDPNAGGQGQPYGGDPYQKDPYGSQPSPPTANFGQGQPADPSYGASGGGYGAPQQDPYGQQSDPYGQPADPYGQQTGDQYGQPTNTYGQPDPYGQQSAPPYGQPDPYAQGGGYGQPSAPPYGQPSGPPYGQPSGAPYGTPPPPPKQSRTGLIVTLVVIGVVVLLALCGGGGYLIYAANQPKPKPTPSQSTGPTQGPTESPSPSPSAAHDISSRATDPTPVTTDELFGRTTVTYNGRTFTRLAVEAPPTCTRATSGTATTLIASSNCSQVLRATYVDNTRQYVATVGIANMADEASAKSVGDAIFADPNKGFWTPLRVPGTVAANFNNTSASVVICSNKNRGHYIGWSIVARADGGTTNTSDPPAKDMGQGLLANINLILNTR